VTGMELVDVEQVAVILRKTTRAVEGLRYRGSLPPCVKVGRSVRWRRADIEAWLDDNTESTAP